MQVIGAEVIQLANLPAVRRDYIRFGNRFSKVGSFILFNVDTTLYMIEYYSESEEAHQANAEAVARILDSLKITQ